MRIAVSFLLLAAATFAAAPENLLRSLPLRFEPGAGDYAWTVRGPAYAIAFGQRDTVLRTSKHNVHLTFDGSNTRAAFSPEQKSLVSTNYIQAGERRSAP